MQPWDLGQQWLLPRWRGEMGLALRWRKNTLMWRKKEWKKSIDYFHNIIDSIIIVIKDLIEDWIAKPFIWLAIIMENIEH